MALFKKNKENRKKGAETTIGKIIYGFLLFMPLLSIGVRCLYVILNRNAYKSFTGNQKYQTTITLQTYINNNNIPTNSFEVGGVTNYYYDIPILTNLITTNSTAIYGDNRYGAYGFNIQEITITKNNEEFVYNNAFVTFSKNRNQDYDAIIQIYENLYFNTSNSYISKSYDNYCKYYINGLEQTPSYAISNLGNSITNVEFIGYDTKFILTSTQNDLINNSITRFDTNIMLATSTIDNVFEYSIEQTQQSNLYNWAKETGTYTVLYNTTSGLGITNEFIPMLMAYWLIVSVIYFLFDIALILIWAVHKKIHELSEAI